MSHQTGCLRKYQDTFGATKAFLWKWGRVGKSDSEIDVSGGTSSVLSLNLPGCWDTLPISGVFKGSRYHEDIKILSFVNTSAPDFKPPEMNERRATGHRNQGTWEVRSTPHKKAFDLSSPKCILEFPQTHIKSRFLSLIDRFGQRGAVSSSS